MDKFNRVYELRVQTVEQNELVIKLPFTLEFDITKNDLSSANIAAIKIYNLSKKNRDQIRKDRQNFDDIRSVELLAGYGTNLAVIFSGQITKAWSHRDGVNFITEIESYDAGIAFVNGEVPENFSVSKEVDNKTVLETLIKKGLPGVTLGVVSPSFAGKTARGKAYQGNTVENIKDLAGGGFFVENGVAYCLAENDCLTGTVDLVDSTTGLLGTPIREENFVTFDMIFEPRLRMAQQIKVVSQTEEIFTGVHKIVGIKHRGTISESICGSAITTVSTSAPGFLTVVPNG